MRVVPATRSFTATLIALATSFMASVGTIAWVVSSSEVRLEPLDATCAQLANTEGSQFSGEWSWFPPGLRCSADYGGSAGWREFAAPSWWDSLVPLALLAISLVWLLAMIISTVRTTARHSKPRGLACGALLLTASATIVGSAPVALDMTGALAVIWVPVALIVASPLLIMTRFLVHQSSEQKSGSG